MRIAAFGDWHLQSRPSLGADAMDEELLLRFLDRLREDHQLLVVTGDLLLSDYGARPGSSQTHARTVLERYPRLWRRLRGDDVRLLHGNHDRVLAGWPGVASELRLNPDGLRLWLSHGDRHDPLLGRCAPYHVTWTIGGLRRLGLGLLSDFLEGPLYRAMQWLASPLDAPHRAARRALERDECEVVVMGHTHRALCRPLGPGVYANTGAPGPAGLPFVSIDSGSALVRLCCWADGEVRELSRAHPAGRVRGNDRTATAAPAATTGPGAGPGRS